MSEVYFKVGDEYKPIGHISDAEITYDPEYADLSDLVSIKNATTEFSATLQVMCSDLSEIFGKLFNPRTLTNNYRRLHGERAIRWRKMR